MIDIFVESVSGINILIDIMHLGGEGGAGVRFNSLIQNQVNRQIPNIDRQSD